MAVNTLEAVALTLSNLLRPPTSVFKDIANELQVCTLLETTTPLQDASGFLLRLLQAGAIPAYSVWPTDPFQVCPALFHGAAANLKRVSARSSDICGLCSIFWTKSIRFAR